MQNLLHNAIKFRRANEPPRVAVSAVAESDAEWLVSVTDNGVGVDPEEAVRIFDMFARVDRHAEGAGIGLAVCRRIVEAHGGRIWAEAAPGGGTSFRFTLPAARPARAGGQRRVSASSTK
jgi:signal transduction histidine kinase